jgi:hypothetical protein
LVFQPIIPVSDSIKTVALSPRLLRLELIELSLLPIDLGLLRIDPPLHLGVLVLPGLHLVADQRAAEKPHGRANAGPGAGVSRGAADDRAQAGAADGSDRSTLLSGRKRFGAAEEKESQC